MGKEWKDAVNKIHSHSPDQKIDKSLLDVVMKAYMQEEKDISLYLTDKTCFHIELLNPDKRSLSIEKDLQTKKIISTEFMIDENRKNTFKIDVDFIRQEVRCYTEVSIEKGKAQAQTTRLIKMFEDDSGYTDNILVDAFYIRKKGNNIDETLSSLVEQKINSEPYSIIDKKFGDEVKYFEIKTKDLLGKDFQSPKNFIVKLEDIANRFLTQIMINKK